MSDNAVEKIEEDNVEGILLQLHMTKLCCCMYWFMLRKFVLMFLFSFQQKPKVLKKPLMKAKILAQ